MGLGYKGTITLNNVSITTTGDTSCILLDGTYGDKVIETTVLLQLIGVNKLHGGSSNSVSCGSSRFAPLCIRAGTKLTIDGTGTLNVKSNSLTYGGGQPAIGCSFSESEWASLRTPQDTEPYLVSIYAGGDLVIKGGTINAEGNAHSAGIGAGVAGGLRNIVIVGGNVTSTGGSHGSGIGGACYAITKGSLVVLPPADVRAYSLNPSADPVGNGGNIPGGTIRILYLGDPNQKKIRISAQPLRGTALTGRQNVNVLFDVSGDSTIAAALQLANLDPTRWYAGTTGTQGYWETTGKIAGNVKVYSDTPTPAGQVYSSKKVSVPGTADVHIIIDDPDMSTPWLQVTQNVTNWTNGSVVLTAKFNPAVTNLVRIRQQGGMWQSVSSMTKTVTSNGTHYFEAENEDGNTMTISHTVTNIDKGTPTINVS